MIAPKLYNNVGIEALAIMLVLQQTKDMLLSKALLILPIITHRELLKYLAHGKTNIQSLEKLIIDKTSFFSNFNKRFYDNLCGTLNAIQFLNEIDLIEVREGKLSVKADMPIDGKMGDRAEKIRNASANIAKILSESSPDKLYLNLRVEL